MAQTEVFLCDIICVNIATLQPKLHVYFDIAQLSLFSFLLVPLYLQKVIKCCFTYLLWKLF